MEFETENAIAELTLMDSRGELSKKTSEILKLIKQDVLYLDDEGMELDILEGKHEFYLDQRETTLKVSKNDRYYKESVLLEQTLVYLLVSIGYRIKTNFN